MRQAAEPEARKDGPSLRLAVPELFSFGENYRYLANASNECLYRFHEGSIYKAVPVGTQAPVVEIREDPIERGIRIRFLGDALPSPAVQAEVVRYVREWFDLDRDLAPFYRLARTDALLDRAVTAFHGLRNMGIPDLFEAISWGILGQQINLAFAYTLKRRLVERFGRRVVCEGETYWTFPTPQDIAGLSEADLSDLRMTVKKCEYLVGVAQLLADGRLSRELLLGTDDLRKVEKLLVGVRGIGPWTANYVLMRCLRMPSAFPVDDVGLHNAIKMLNGMERKPTKPEILALSAGWTGWESYATFYLWRFLY
ncbi:DNA-3-methyladenine glycosylase 2 family protein [Cohnella nanjingensis]|uniref:DNA-3-methyladenine glycosylase II n=2 Tax=Cohnella nanjingensis TaxID=1387779 RepID=A0A7X0RWS1_9BACL|nr:DNA-3-methyladenine glycosylase 2 family protein [Cohnella nanjingensis]